MTQHEKQRAYACIAAGLVVWDRAENAACFLQAKGFAKVTQEDPDSVELYELDDEDYEMLNLHGWVGVAAENVARRGSRVTFGPKK